MKVQLSLSTHRMHHRSTAISLTHSLSLYILEIKGRPLVFAKLWLTNTICSTFMKNFLIFLLLLTVLLLLSCHATNSGSFKQNELDETDCEPCERGDNSTYDKRSADGSADGGICCCNNGGEGGSGSSGGGEQDGGGVGGGHRPGRGRGGRGPRGGGSGGQYGRGVGGGAPRGSYGGGSRGGGGGGGSGVVMEEDMVGDLERVVVGMEEEVAVVMEEGKVQDMEQATEVMQAAVAVAAAAAEVVAGMDDLEKVVLSCLFGCFRS